MGENVRIESAKDLRGNSSNLPRADNADRFSRDVESDQAIQGKVVLTHAIECAMKCLSPDNGGRAAIRFSCDIASGHRKEELWGA